MNKNHSKAGNNGDFCLFKAAMDAEK